MAELVAGYVPVKEVARELGVSTSTVRRLLACGLWPFIRYTPRKIAVRADVVERWQRHGTPLLEGYLRGELTADEVRARLTGELEIRVPGQVGPGRARGSAGL